MAIEQGTVVEVTTASGERVRMRALGRPQRGRDFPVLWVCTEDEYALASETDHEADGLPWPLDAVSELEHA